MSVKPRKTAKGKTVYDVFYRIPGTKKRTCRRGLPRDIAYDLEDKMNRLNAACRAGISLTDITVGELYEEWIGHKEQHVKASTLANYKSLYENHIKEYMAEKLIFDVRTSEIQRLVDGLAERPRTANSTLTVIKAMLRQAVIWGYLEANPAAEVRRIPQPEKERPFLTQDEARTLLDQLEGQERLLVLTALVTGMRQGELAALKWEDIGEGRIRVRRSYRKGVFSDPKTYYGKRDVLIPKWLEDELEQVRGKPHYLVFPDEPYGPLPDWKMSKRILKPALEKAEIEKPIRFHDLRHTTAAWMISQGESPKLVQEQLGHYSPEFTMRRYGHLAPDAKAAAMRRFGKAVSNIHQRQSKQEGRIVELAQVKRNARP